MHNIIAYQRLFSGSINELDQDEKSIDDLTEKLLDEIIKKVETKIEDTSREIFGKPDYEYMYGRLKLELELEMSDLIYETIELKNTIRRLKS